MNAQRDAQHQANVERVRDINSRRYVDYLGNRHATYGEAAAVNAKAAGILGITAAAMAFDVITFPSGEGILVKEALEKAGERFAKSGADDACEKAAREAAEKAAAKEVEGTKVYRVWGDEAGPNGRSWTTVDPRTVPNYRDAAGLPTQNTGRFVSEGVIKDGTGVQTRGALPLHGNQGGLPEVIIPNPATQVELHGVSGVNPGS
jgi:hypothetical protein